MPYPFSAGSQVGRNTVVTRDAKGNVAYFRYYIDYSAGTLASAQAFSLSVNNAFSALSNGAQQATWGLDNKYGVAQYGAHASGGAYESVIEKAVLVFQDAAGQLHRFEVPAPKIAIFKADKVTVDPANGLVVTFIGLMASGTFGVSATVVSRQDIPLANFMGGVFRGRKLRRRLNILVLEPDLTAGLPAE